MPCSVNIEIMRKFKVEEPIEKSRNNDQIVLSEFLFPLYNKVINNDIVTTGANASSMSRPPVYLAMIGTSSLKHLSTGRT